LSRLHYFFLLFYVERGLVVHVVIACPRFIIKNKSAKVDFNLGHYYNFEGFVTIFYYIFDGFFFPGTAAEKQRDDRPENEFIGRR
jgi:hypothetical protein